jgi:hypothetical protein
LNTPDKKTQTKLDLFMDFFALCEDNGISLFSQEFQQISQFAVRDAFINYAEQEVKSLADIEIEELSQRNAAIIIKRARTGLKRILEMKKKYTAGPFKTSRHFRRAQEKFNKTSKSTHKASDNK